MMHLTTFPPSNTSRPCGAIGPFFVYAQKKTHLSLRTDKSHHLKRSQDQLQYVDNAAPKPVPTTPLFWYIMRMKGLEPPRLPASS